MGLKDGIVENLIGLAAVDGAMGNHGRALHLAAATETLRAELGFVLPPLQQGVYEKVVATARAVRGERSFAMVWAEGEAMSSEQAINYALEETTTHD